MSEELNIAPAEETTTTEPATSEAEKEETVGEMLEKEERVPLSAHIELKKAEKESRRLAQAQAKEIEDLRRQIQNGDTKREVSSSIKQLADKHGIDASFLQDFAETVRLESESAVSEKLRPIEEKERKAKLNEVFTTKFSKSMEKFPELDGVVNKDLIFQASLHPDNQNKTLTQLIEEAYGKVNTSRPAFDVPNTRGRVSSGEVDFDRAKNDGAYFKEVMDNPELKKKYNSTMLERIANRM